LYIFSTPDWLLPLPVGCQKLHLQRKEAIPALFRLMLSHPSRTDRGSADWTGFLSWASMESFMEALGAEEMAFVTSRQYLHTQKHATGEHTTMRDGQISRSVHANNALNLC
jgi:hypothetical protein